MHALEYCAALLADRQGAGALVLASQAAVDKHNLKPLSRVVAWSVAGVDPTVMHACFFSFFF